MNNWYMYHLYETRRRQDEIKLAENYRLAKGDRFSPPSKPNTSQRLYTTLGSKMIQWGCKLLARYGNLIITQDEKSLVERLANN